MATIKTNISTVKLKGNAKVPGDIKEKCKVAGERGYRLAATFTEFERLILIFQK